LATATGPWDFATREAAEFLQPKATEQALMSKQPTAELRELTDDEFDAVNGGLVVIAIIAILIGPLLPPPPQPIPKEP
jgi:hypothetical protein